MCEPNESNYITCSLYAPSFKSHVILFVYIRHFERTAFGFPIILVHYREDSFLTSFSEVLLYG